MKKYFLNVSKSRLSQLSKVQLKTRPRAMQVYLTLLLWVDRCGYSLGVEYIGSLASGQLCWHKDLKIYISRRTGLKHRQIQRYLREFERKGLIYIDDKQFWFDGKVRRQYFLNPHSDLRAKTGERYLVLNMRGCGKQGFDIYSYLEDCIRADSHPGHTDQLKFNVSRQTRSYRSKPKTYKPKPKRRSKIKKQLSFASCKKMTPKKRSNRVPFYRMEQKTTNSTKKFKNSYQNQLCLIHKTQRIWVDWWKTKKAASEYIKVQAGLDFSDRALWYSGRLYRQTASPYVYEFVAKPRRRWQSVPDYGPCVPSVAETRKIIADNLGLSVPEYLKRCRQQMQKIKEEKTGILLKRGQKNIAGGGSQKKSENGPYKGKEP